MCSQRFAEPDVGTWAHAGACADLEVTEVAATDAGHARYLLDRQPLAHAVSTERRPVHLEGGVGFLHDLNVHRTTGNYK